MNAQVQVLYVTIIYEYAQVVVYIRTCLKGHKTVNQSLE